MTLQIQDEQLIERLQAIADKRETKIEDVIREMVDFHLERQRVLGSFRGMFKNDITDISKINRS